jgi:hypothetical protein
MVMGDLVHFFWDTPKVMFMHIGGSGRRTARMHGQEIAATMGVNTWAAFAGTDQRAVVDGDFANEGDRAR